MWTIHSGWNGSQSAKSVHNWSTFVEVRMKYRVLIWDRCTSTSCFKFCIMHVIALDEQLIRWMTITIFDVWQFPEDNSWAHNQYVWYAVVAGLIARRSGCETGDLTRNSSLHGISGEHPLASPSRTRSWLSVPVRPTLIFSFLQHGHRSSVLPLTLCRLNSLPGTAQGFKEIDHWLKLRSLSHHRKPCFWLQRRHTAWKWMSKAAKRWYVRGLRAKPQDIMRSTMSFGEPWLQRISRHRRSHQGSHVATVRDLIPF